LKKESQEKSVGKRKSFWENRKSKEKFRRKTDKNGVASENGRKENDPFWVGKKLFSGRKQCFCNY
jgi:hypothetical protein